MNYRQALLTTAAAIGFLSAAPEAFAQEAAGSAHIEEVVVTARRRDESAQTTPVAVSALSGDQLVKRNALTIQSLTQSIPSTRVTVATSNRQAAVFNIRGQFQNANTFALDPSVAVYIDDVYQARAYGVNGDFLDLAGVEVDKGPQGVLFGRNSTGGAIRFTTTKPNASSGVTGYLRAGYGNYNDVRVTGAVNIPIIPDVLAVRYAGLHHSHAGYDDAYLMVPGSGVVTRKIEVNDLDTMSHRLSLRYTPGTKLAVDLSVDDLEGDDHGMMISSAPTGGDLVFPGPVMRRSAQAQNDFYAAVVDTDPRTSIVSHGARAQVQYDFNDNLTTKVIYGYRGLESHAIQDTFGTAWAGLGVPPANTAGLLNFPGTVGFFYTSRSQSAEWQLLGNALDDRLDWVTGLYYFIEHGGETNDKDQTVDGRLLSDPSIARRYTATYGRNLSKSVYAHAGYKLTDQWSVSAGLRYTEDEKKVSTRVFTATAPAIGVEGPPTCGLSAAAAAANCTLFSAAKGHALTWAVDIGYRPNPDLYIYAKAGTGYRSGGPQGSAVDSSTARPFAPEKVTDYEVGFKSELFDRRVRFNADVWFDHTRDLQFTAIVNGTPTAQFPAGPTAQFTENVGDVDRYGVEAELTAILGAGFSAQASLGYFEENHDIGNIFSPGSGRTTNNVIIEQKPFNASISLVYDRDLGFGDLNARIDYARVPGYYGTILGPVVGAPLNTGAFDPRNKTKPYDIVNGRVALAMKADWELAFWVTNIFDKKYLLRSVQVRAASTAGGIANYTTVPGDPRLYGAEISYKW
jgi:iron complex outermembrane receptor protein